MLGAYATVFTALKIVLPPSSHGWPRRLYISVSVRAGSYLALTDSTRDKKHSTICTNLPVNIVAILSLVRLIEIVVA